MCECYCLQVLESIHTFPKSNTERFWSQQVEVIRKHGFMDSMPTFQLIAIDLPPAFLWYRYHAEGLFSTIEHNTDHP